ncbi:ATP-dependent RNA helicase DBP5 [Vairimorpha necatrix]|uniref:ATP-dependent RNA helicase n=1 Tax=Vairimorpha necatrix TaxID=6039 RepID=A0AAX4JA26_9MICR
MNSQTIQSAYDVAKELFEEIKRDTDIQNTSKQDPEFQMVNTQKFLALESFESLELGDNIQKALYEEGYTKPSKIQKTVIPGIKAKVDIVVQSQSGTGKTLAFVIGILTQIEEGKGVQAVILSPTRELNMQIYNEICKVTRYTNIKTFLALRDKQADKLNQEIVLGSPGSILNLCTRRQLDNRNIKIFVLDETDMLLEKTTMGSQTFRLLKAFEGAQKVFISATYNDEIKKTISAYAPECSELYEAKNAKPDEIKLYHLDIYHKERIRALKSLFELLTVGQVIVFVSRKATIKKLEQILIDDSNSVGILHGDLTLEERDEVVRDFKSSTTKILICTDVFSRGMDIPQVNLIINYDLPYVEKVFNSETYIHRIGRAGRFGKTGFVIDMITGQKELEDYLEVQHQLGTVSKRFTLEELESVNLNETG